MAMLFSDVSLIAIFGRFVSFQEMRKSKMTCGIFFRQTVLK